MNTFQKRMLQIRGMKNAEGAKPRFNEDVDEETRSIRQDAAHASQKLKVNNVHRSNQLRNTSLNDAASRRSSLCNSLNSVPVTIDRQSNQTGVTGASSTRFAVRQS